MRSVTFETDTQTKRAVATWIGEQRSGRTASGAGVGSCRNQQSKSSMTYRIKGLDPAPFRNLFGLSDDKLAKLGARRVVADAKPGYPDRVELRDVEPGETPLLV